MQDLDLSGHELTVLRALMADEPVPGRPLPGGDVLHRLNALVPCDLLGTGYVEPGWTPLRPKSFPSDPRTYTLLSELEFDAFHARIWGGFHYRRAMTDCYDIAHRTADAVLAAYGE